MKPLIPFALDTATGITPSRLPRRDVGTSKKGICQCSQCLGDQSETQNKSPFSPEGITSRVFSKSGFEVLDITPSHVIQLHKLPLHHHDRFDRMLIAQAQTENASLMTVDGKIGKYKVGLSQSLNFLNQKLNYLTFFHYINI